MAERILLVEDQAIIALSEAETLRKHGFEVTTVHSAERAVEAAAGDPDLRLVLMDIDLGQEMDGIEAARAILKDRELPIVFLTGHSEKEYIERVKEVTRYGYVLKSSGELVLMEAIQMALELFASHRHLQDEIEERKQAEKRLREQERKYRGLFDSIRDAILVADTERKIIDCNPAFCELFGYRREELEGEKTVAVYNSPREFEAMGAAIAAHRGNLADFLYTVRYRKKDGSVFPGETNVFYLKDDDGEVVGFIGLIRDISARLEMETRLRQSEEHLRTTLQSIGDAVITTDVDGRVGMLNRVAERLTGWCASEARGKDLSEVFHIVNSQTREQVVDPVEKVLRSAAIVGLANHTVLISSEGHEYHIADSAAPITDGSGAVRGVVLVFRDVTEEYRQEQKLAESERRLQTLMANLPGMAYRCRNDHKWSMEFVSKGVHELTGYRDEEVVENRVVAFADLILPEEQERVWDTVQQAISRGARFQVRYRIRTREGHVKWVWEQGVEVNAGAGEPPGDPNGATLPRIEGFITDVTDEVRAKRGLERTLDEKESLLRELNHRVKNNLALVSSLISIKTSTLAEQIAEDVDFSDLQNQIRAVQLVHEKLNKGRDLSDVDLHDYIGDILEALFESSLDGEVEVENNIENTRIPTRIAVTLGLITTEIATNARKYGFGETEKKRFSVSFRADPESGLCTYGCSTPARGSRRTSTSRIPGASGYS